MSSSKSSPSVHDTVVTELSGESGSSFLMERVGEVGSKPFMSPFEALDGSLGFSPTKHKAKGGPRSPKVGLCPLEKICFPGLAKGFIPFGPTQIC